MTTFNSTRRGCEDIVCERSTVDDGGFWIVRIAGDTICGVRNGDTITLDVEARRLDVDADLEARRSELAIREPRYETGVFAKYVKLVASASEGAITI